MEQKTLHSVFENPDPDIQFPVSFPQFLPCNPQNATSTLQNWVQHQLVENCVYYKIRTQFENKLHVRQAILQCSFKLCSHQVICRLEQIGWKLLSATSHRNHVPGSLEDIKQLKMSEMTRGKIENLCKQGMSNLQIKFDLKQSISMNLKGEKLKFMLANKSIMPSCKDIENVRRALQKQLSVGNERKRPEFEF